MVIFMLSVRDTSRYLYDNIQIYLIFDFEQL